MSIIGNVTNLNILNSNYSKSDVIFLKYYLEDFVPI